MSEVTLDFIAEQIALILDELRATRKELVELRDEIKACVKVLEDREEPSH
jgi:hypothetical protein